jgi:hypothetical protein
MSKANQILSGSVFKSQACSWCATAEFAATVSGAGFYIGCACVSILCLVINKKFRQLREMNFFKLKKNLVFL